MAEKILSAGILGLKTQLVEVESDIGGGELGSFYVVGLPDKSVSEARERVRSAIKSIGIKFPQRKIIINLAPANFKKQGPSYDVPMAISILSVLYKLKEDFKTSIFLGELALNGDVRPVNGILSIISSFKKSKIKKIYIPLDNVNEVKLISRDDFQIFPVKNIKELFFHLIHKKRILAYDFPKLELNNSTNFLNDFSSIKGQKQAKRALEIAAAGAHNIFKLWTKTPSL